MRYIDKNSKLEYTYTMPPILEHLALNADRINTHQIGYP